MARSLRRVFAGGAVAVHYDGMQYDGTEWVGWGGGKIYRVYGPIPSDPKGGEA